MKSTKIVFYILMFLPLTATIIALQFMPPLGAGVASPERWNAPYETLLIPLAGFLFAWLINDIISTSTKNDESGNKVNVGLLAMTVILVVFNYFTYRGLANQFSHTGTVPFPRDLYQLIAGIVGIIILAYANIVPKLPMKSPLGLRTRWSLLDEIAWKQSQIGAGVAMIIAGVITVVLSVYFTGWTLILAMFAAIFLAVIAAAAYSYKVAQDDPF